ncbi:MAG: hypothetical protein QXN34_06830 [Archaeoglobaceae archaeon]
MTFTIDNYTLNVTDFGESSEPVGAEWHTWENEKITIKRYVYGIKRTWRLSCIEKNVVWNNSAAKYLQQKMSAGETVSFAVNEGDRFSLPATECYVVSLEIDIKPLGQENIRYFDVVLKEK